MNWRNLPDAHERVKYHGGYDPSDPPTDQEPDTMMCDCGHRSFDEEIHWLGERSICVNCSLGLLEQDEAKFWQNVNKGSVNDCWNWTGLVYPAGYAIFRSKLFNDHRIAGHRFSYYLKYGILPMPQGLHRCDNPRCVNPNHIFEGTQADNVHDCRRKGRARWVKVFGIKNGQSKLDDNKVRQVRKMHANGISMRAIGRYYKVAGRTIKKIVDGTHWKHVK